MANKEKTPKEILTKEDVVEVLTALKKAFDIVESNDELKNEINNNLNFESYVNGMRTGAFTPAAQNELMKSININTQVPDSAEIEKALNAPAANEDKLISYSQSYYFSSLMYKRNLEYLAKLPAFDLEFNCINAEEDDYNKPSYKKDYKIIADFLDKFDYRKQFKEITWNMLLNETYFGMFREFDTQSLFQTWPLSYAKISGKFEYGLLYDVDMAWFLQPQVDINEYPTWCKQKYLEMFKDGKVQTYIPSQKLNRRTGSFGVWAQTDPTDGFWCFKFNHEHNLQVPFFSAMLPEMAIIPTMRSLQVSQSMAAARKLLVSSIPYLNDKKSASIVNQLAIDANTLGKFIGLATAGLEAAIKVLPLPTEDIKGVEFENTDRETYKNFMAVTSSLLSGGKVIFSVGERLNVEETKLSLNIDELLMQSIYPQFEQFLNFVINKKTKKFKFKFRFIGCNDELDRNRRQKEVFTYADKGIVLINKIASSLGLNKIELERELNETKASGLTDKLMMLLNTNTMSDGGRPQNDDDNLTESGSETRGAGSNIAKGGKI